MSIPSHILDQLNSRADLVGIIGKHTTLKKAGREFKGCCPFHGEKTPSFYVNPQKNMYNCFGCGVGGNAISFLKDYENLTFMEAVRELSRQTGIEIPEEDNRHITYQKRPEKQLASSQHPSQNQPQQRAKPPSSLSPTSQKLELPQQTKTKDTTSPVHTADNPSYFDGNISGNESNQTNTQASEHLSSEDAWYMSAIADDLSKDNQYGRYGVINFNGTHDVHFEHSSTNVLLPQHQHQSAIQEGNLYELLDAIAKFYQQQLHAYPHALAYFKNRGLSDDTLQTFVLGYAPQGWQHLEEAFASDIDGLKMLGLIRTSDSGRDYDLLRDRVIFPIKDNQGRIIGFAGRALDDEVKPKYINSSDSPVFHKQHVLYGYYESRQHRANDWLIVEGYMDVIALYQAGIYGAVASMGTALAESQISRLLQMNPVLTLCFDGDGAGQKAAWRALETSLPVLSDDKELRFLTLPNGHDPDTFIDAHGVEAMREQIASAMPLSQYVYVYLSQQQNAQTAEGKAKIMAQVKQLTSQLPKGSSFRYLLNNDIYTRVSGRNIANTKLQRSMARDALLDFAGGLTLSRQLALCLLYAPHLLAKDPVQALWQRSGVTNLVDTSPQHAHSLSSQPLNPELPSWESFQDDTLKVVVDTIKHLLPYLPDPSHHSVGNNTDLSKPDLLNNDVSNQGVQPNPQNRIGETTDSQTAKDSRFNTEAIIKSINITAHFIMASLPSNLQQPLAQQWQPFWQSMQRRGIIDVTVLVDDLLMQLMLMALSHQVANAKHITAIGLINHRRQILSNWHKQWQASMQNI